ncbi:uncharacterized protein LOC141620491 [Silene latifolia]|uniref:uncharacterized protein LOC141620491 n=1 Tax=Silene latifolia TaxID=37657 RepID=UPI003D788D2B
MTMKVPQQPKVIFPEFCVEMSIPPQVMRILMRLSEAFMSSVAFTPINFMDRYPNQIIRRPALSLLTWNAQGADSNAFFSMLKEINRINKPQVVALVETHISGSVAQRLTGQESEKLSRNYVVADVQYALSQMSPFKAPGPDGFQDLFYQSQWDTISPSLCAMIFGTLHDNVLPEGLGETFISLIPKVDHPHLLSQFRPIGLCNVAYKIITKMIINHLKPILPILINLVESSFVPRRQISDNIIIVQEAFHSMRSRKGKTGIMALKLDLEKAYDKLEWPFIEFSLRDMGLATRMINTIMRCIKSATLNVLWNGERTEPFAPTRVYRYFPQVDVQSITNELQISNTDDLGMYLGMPTLNGRVTKESFEFIAKKVDKRLTGWKSKNLSLVGRVTLIESTLSSIPTDAMQTAKLPRSLYGDLDKKVNTAFMAKLGWRVLLEPNSIWARIFRHKYCMGRCDMDMFKNKSASSNVWRGIADVIKTLKPSFNTSIGNGKATQFWKHTWATKVPLESFTPLQIPAQLIKKKVEDMWDSTSGWRWELFADFFSFEILQTIASFEVISGGENEDRILWAATPSCFFSIKSAIRLLRNDADEERGVYWKLSWKTWIPQRIRVYF